MSENAATINFPLQMSEEQLNSFLEKVKADAGLQKKLKTAANADDVVATAKESGLSISAADDLQTGQEISDEALDGVAGGSIGGGGGTVGSDQNNYG